MKLWDVFPYTLVEVLNGILSVTLFWMLAFGAGYLWRTYRDLRKRYGGPGGWLRIFKHMHNNNKPEVALMTIVAALFIRTMTLWLLRVVENGNLHGPFPNTIREIGPLTLVCSTAVMIVGVLCWVRVISPFDGRQAAYIWISMIASSLLISLGVAYFI